LPTNAPLYDKLNFDFVPRLRAGRRHHARAQRDEVHPSVPVITTEPLIRCGLAPCAADPPGVQHKTAFGAPLLPGAQTRATALICVAGTCQGEETHQRTPRSHGGTRRRNFITLFGGVTSV